MYIFSQDKSTLMEFTRCVVNKNFGGKKTEKYLVTAYGKDGALPQVIGSFPTEEEAREELLNIISALKENKLIYEVKDNKTEVLI